MASARRSVATLDSRGRLSLGRYGLKNMTVVIEELEDGGVSIQPAVVLTEAEAAHYRSPEAEKALRQGLADVEAGRISESQFRPV